MSDPRSMQTPSEAGAATGAGEIPAAACGAAGRAAVYRLVAQGFRDPDSRWLCTLEEAASDVAAVGFAEVWSAPEDAPRIPSRSSTCREGILGPALEGTPDTALERILGTALVAAITRFLDSLLDPETMSEIRDVNQRLFGHTVAGSCPLYETAYGEWSAFQQPHTLADLAGTYRAFGLVPSDRARERPDHVSVECEFLYVLSRKEAWAYQHSGPAEVAVCVDARRMFLSEHLGRWTPALADQLTRYASDSFYGRLGELLVALIRDECKRLDIEMGDRELTVGVEGNASQDTCFACPEGPACFEMPAKGQEGERGV